MDEDKHVAPESSQARDSSQAAGTKHFGAPTWARRRALKMQEGLGWKLWRTDDPSAGQAYQSKAAPLSAVKVKKSGLPHFGANKAAKARAHAQEMRRFVCCGPPPAAPEWPQQQECHIVVQPTPPKSKHPSGETNEEPQAPGSQEKRIRNSVLLRVPM
mmetsp:Transcript_17773/g.33984  ORF Transcript_17773/g.33984 Transcript_17773/m.33984 type:complete len:158 (-) Transcript_17773:372-845(-)|eukprot:CAMPEP_0114256736 /NCGR_PEP_ID=MMETSP0058-20121206/18334_1 /TAXON_ID=36894 /ORGANISM="Pyramimonas parkeae, CCMP726" /LENGTH=157 /DNA_ID=CAMNT_0001371367 /DNA_START=759 /DNA_END=1232 /DNA_ORIENTATION=+